jgi:hypothetical protein
MHTILHEIGHWNHFCESGKKPYNFLNQDKNWRIEREEKAEQFADEYIIKCLSALPKIPIPPCTVYHF